MGNGWGIKMVYISEISLVILWALMALWQAHLIKNNRPILHGWWAFVSGSFISISCLCLPNAKISTISIYVTAQCCMRLSSFNIFLNLFRGEKWYYTSSTSGSILDKIEIRLFGEKMWLLEIFLLVVFLAINLFQ